MSEHKGLLDSEMLLFDRWYELHIIRENTRPKIEIEKLSLQKLVDLYDETCCSDIISIARAYWEVTSEIKINERCAIEFKETVEKMEDSFKKYRRMQMIYSRGIGTGINVKKAMEYALLVEKIDPMDGLMLIPSIILIFGIESDRADEKLEIGLKHGILRGVTDKLFTLGQLYTSMGRKEDARFMFDKYLMVIEGDKIYEPFRNHALKYIEDHL